METSESHSAVGHLIDRIKNKHTGILDWLESLEKANELPLYSSVDIRDASFKAAVIDTNLFPAGFNNLCEHGLTDAQAFLRQAILKRVPNCKDILIVAEEHTRNTWYLENIRILQQMINHSGFHARIATFLKDEPEFCQVTKSVTLETAAGQAVQIYCFQKILDEYKSGREHFDLIILNNDLTTGIPDILKNAGVPIYPSIQAGWHARLKSIHFSHTFDLMEEFSQILDVDPWLFSCLFSVENKIDINIEADRNRLRDSAATLFAQITDKYREHQIHDRPFIFIKSDSGTYGMGILPLEDPDDILRFNRKDRNKLHVGKSAQVIDRYLLQEGVPTIYRNGPEISEVCIYQIENNLIGGFYRSHSGKSPRENLNARGMEFKKMCPHLKKYGTCGVHHDVNVFDVYRILARIAGIAASREMVQLETNGPRNEES